jgi:hypothetical protein
MKARLKEVAFGLALTAAAVLLVLPIYSGFNGTRPSRATLVEINGPWILLLLAIPVVITLQPLVFRRHSVQVVTTILIAGFTVLSSFSIGLFFVPATIVTLLATFAKPTASNG